MFEGMTSDEIVGVLAVWLVAAGIVALIASSRGRSQVNWFALAVLLSPVIAFLAVVLMPKVERPSQPISR